MTKIETVICEWLILFDFCIFCLRLSEARWARAVRLAVEASVCVCARVCQALFSYMVFWFFACQACFASNRSGLSIYIYLRRAGTLAEPFVRPLEHANDTESIKNLEATSNMCVLCVCLCATTESEQEKQRLPIYFIFCVAISFVFQCSCFLKMSF